MTRSLLRASVTGLLLALVGTVDSQAQEPPSLPGIVIEPPPSPVFAEGEYFAVGVMLDAAPSAPASVSFRITGLTDGLAVTFSPSSLNFDPDNWNTLQQVGVQVGEDDDAVPDEGRFEYTIDISGLSPITTTLPLPIRILDNDMAALSLSREFVELTEGGDAQRYTVSLAAKPTADVIVELSLEGAQEGQISIDPDMLTFTPERWNESRTVALQAPDDTGAAQLEGATIRHTNSGAPEFAGAPPAPLQVSVVAPPEPLPAVEFTVRSLPPDGFEVLWTPLSHGLVAGYRVEYEECTECTETVLGDPGSHPGRFAGRSQSSHQAFGFARDSVYQVRVTAFQDSEAFPHYGIPPAPRLVVIGEDIEVAPALSGSADAASALVARGIGSSVLESVAARVGADRESVAHASSAGLASWARAFAQVGLSSRTVLSVHERSPDERAERERESRGPSRGWGLPAGPVERGDWSLWLRADFPGLGGQTDARSLDGSAQVLQLGIERSIEPPGALDRFSEATRPEGEWIAGVGLGLASATIDIDPADASLDHSTWLLYPYLGYRDARRLAYASIGGGVGTSRFSHPSFEPNEIADQDSLLVFAGLGGAAVIGGRPDRLEFLVRASALGTLANTDGGAALVSSTVAAHRLRFGLDTRHTRNAGGGTLSPSGGLGVLYDAGDGPGGVAVEVDAGTRFDWRRFSFSVRVRTFLESSDEIDRTLGITGAVRYSPGNSRRGFFFALSPSYGAGPNDGPPWDRVLASSDPLTSGLRLSTEGGYTFSAPTDPGLVTVVAGVRSRADEVVPNLISAGVHYRGGGSLTLAVDANRTLETGSLAPSSAVSFRARWLF